jgi:uncharacterized protein YqeY
MSFFKKLDNDLKSALKNSDKVKLSVLRLLKAALKNQQIDKKRELFDDEILSVFSTLAKQRRESIEQFSKGGRDDLAENERQELSILQSYMPKQLSAEEIESAILQAIRKCNSSGNKRVFSQK